jgi:hypothetical protein
LSVLSFLYFEANTGAESEVEGGWSWVFWAKKGRSEPQPLRVWLYEQIIYTSLVIWHLVHIVDTTQKDLNLFNMGYSGCCRRASPSLTLWKPWSGPSQGSCPRSSFANPSPLLKPVIPHDIIPVVYHLLIIFCIGYIISSWFLWFWKSSYSHSKLSDIYIFYNFCEVILSSLNIFN